MDFARAADAGGDGHLELKSDEAAVSGSEQPGLDAKTPRNRGIFRAEPWYAPAQEAETLIACNILNGMTARGRPASYAIGA